jgi:hypothetical protein
MNYTFSSLFMLLDLITLIIQGPFAKFVDSLYYSESELCGDEVMVSFSKYLTWQVMHFLQLSTHFSKMCCKPLNTQNFLPWRSCFMVGKAQKSDGARSELNSVFSLEKVDQWNPIRTYAIQSRSHPMQFLGFSNHDVGAPRQETAK